MNKHFKIFTRYRMVIYLAGLLLSITSCVSTSRMKYVYEGDELNIKNSYYNQRPERLIKPYDELYIKILSIEGRSVVSMLDAQDGQVFGNNVNLIFYQVSDSGNINIPFIKDIHIAGLSLFEAKEKIENELSGYLETPSVIIKYVNLQVTVLGEVNRPGTYTYVREPINIFQAIGLAGGIAQYGNKETVVLIREENGLITRNVLDLTDQKTFESYYYYLQPDDIIFVDHVKAKYYGKGAINYSTFLSTITTLLAVVYFFSNTQ